MHIHGHEFYVMQKGYGKIDMDTMNLYPNGSHPAFECTPGEPYCATTRQVWPDEKLNLQYDGIQKRTTVTIPANGWVVVRFIANNPGMWLFHCHTFSHLMEGQAILLDVTDQGIPKVPAGFPTCPVNSPERIGGTQTLFRNLPKFSSIEQIFRSSCLASKIVSSREV